LETADVVVVGLGAIGSATCHALAGAGIDVLGLEQYELGHARGASHDHSRIIRRSYHTPAYVELAGAAYEAWERVPSSEPLVVRTGGLDLFPPGAAIALDDYAASMDAVGVPYSGLSAAEVAQRWPAWELPDGTVALFQADTGIVAAERATAALRAGAVAHGARLLGGRPVHAIRDDHHELVVVTDAGDVRTGRVVLAADAWTNELLVGLDRELPLTVTQEQLTYTRPDDPDAFMPARWPVWIWMDEPSFYGFPEFGEPGWVKTAQDCGGREVTARTRSFDPDPEAEARLVDFLHAHLPRTDTGERRSTTCLYTLTPDRDFVLDAVPGHPEVLVALGSAHGFKFAALFGEILRDLVLGKPPAPDLGPFRFDRPALTDPAAPKTWLV
jgi:sarcosine oxidase